jgi:hypothetical protein
MQHFFSLIRESLDKSHNDLRDAGAVAAIKLLLKLIRLTVRTMHMLEWWPNKVAAQNYFQRGHLYRFTNHQIWHTLWADEQKTKQLLRLKPGSVFMVLECKVMFPNGILLHVLQNETLGWIFIEESAQYAPWVQFEVVETDHYDRS